MSCTYTRHAYVYIKQMLINITVYSKNNKMIIAILETNKCSRFWIFMPLFHFEVTVIISTSVLQITILLVKLFYHICFQW